MNSKLKAIDYHYEWERQAFCYYLYIFSKAWLPRKFSPSVNTVFTFDEGRAVCYLNKKQLDKAGVEILKRVEKSDSYLKRWSREVYKSGKNIHKFCDWVERIDLKKMNDRDLWNIYFQAFTYYDQHDYHIVIIRNANRLLLEKLQGMFDAATNATILATDKKSFFTLEHEDLLKMAQKIYRGAISQAERKKLITSHLKKYFYLPCGYYKEKILKIENIEKNLRRIVYEKKTLVNFREKINRNSDVRNKLLKKLKLTKKVLRLVNFGSDCTYFKDYIRSNLNLLIFNNNRIFSEISRRTGYSLEIVANVLLTEMKDVLISRKPIKSFKQAIIFSDGKKVYKMEESKATSIIMEFNNSRRSNVQELQGTPANMGKVKGRALIVHDIRDTLNKKNFILIAPMTTPDLMSAMRKSLAIVTDEGGLTSHAAIVARELDIPCIVGTKMATKIFKNNDLVEVDANKGIVKILNRV